mmetsp:Transcript_155/g.492  ORF Transcript_155/g.492 Transcript_155/m.492 type:complete len:721 (-) Transcript_155:36-2198(-)
MIDGGLALSIIPEQAVKGGEEDVCVLCTVTNPEGSVRTPTDICCILDISWSMSALAAGEKDESGGLSLLDIAKHAVRTMIKTLGVDDRLSIVSFCNQAETVLELTAMDAAGQDAAEKSLEKIGYGSGTALWEGLSSGLQSMRKGGVGAGRFGHILLLTDGVASDKEDVMPNLRDLVQQWERLPCAIYPFGFGYEIDSKLLLEVAEYSHGSYAFIPDAGFVGTCFVNAVSNLLVTMAEDVRLTLKPEGGASVLEGQGSLIAAPSAGQILQLNLGTLQYGQTKDVVIRMKMPASDGPYLSASLTCTVLNGKSRIAASGSVPASPTTTDIQRVQEQQFRSKFISTTLGAARLAELAAVSEEEIRRIPQYATLDQVQLNVACEDMLKQAELTIKDLASLVQRSPLSTQSGHPVAALLEDIVGQTMEAFSCLDYFRKWGRHYVVSIACAHRSQQCTNFKDPGVQVYGGTLFNRLRDDADDTFNTLAAPQPTNGQYRYILGGWRNGRLQPGKVIHNPDFHGGTSVAPSTAAAVINMADFNDRYCGCVHGDSVVHLADGQCIAVASLRKGDIVQSGVGGATARIECIVRSQCPRRRACFVRMAGGLKVTPYHPVLVDGEWRFPADLGSIDKEEECQEVYNFILSGAPAILIGDLPCVALGHGIQDGAARHEFFGTPRVVEDLVRFPGFTTGCIDLPPEATVRDPVTSLVCAYRSHMDAALSLSKRDL